MIFRTRAIRGLRFTGGCGCRGRSQGPPRAVGIVTQQNAVKAAIQTAAGRVSRSMANRPFQRGEQA
jgi:hypothetical protein